MIPREILNEIQNKTSIADVVGRYITLKKRGRSSYWGLCPFHGEKSPSFHVDDAKKMFYCLAGETQVITWDGVRPIRELAGGIHRILTSNGEWVHAPFYSFGVQPLMKVTLTRNRRKKVIYATSEHRWFLRVPNKAATYKERLTKDLRSKDTLSYSFPKSRICNNVRPSPFGIAHGIVFGDGSRFHSGSAVALHGEKIELRSWFPLNHHHNYTRDGGHDYPLIVDLPAFFKDRPSLDESVSYLLGWLAGYFATDGCVAEDGTVILSSAVEENLEFVRELCTRIGVGTYEVTSQYRMGIDGKMSNLYRVHLIGGDLPETFFLRVKHRDRIIAAGKKATERRGWVVQSVESSDRVEEVFCAVVENTHAFALEDNILTGNCFGCHVGGDVFKFVQSIENRTFMDVVIEFASAAAISLPDREMSESEKQDRAEREGLYKALEVTAGFYEKVLLQSSEAIDYLHNRGVPYPAAKEARLGFAPDSWDLLGSYLERNGILPAIAAKAGLLIPRENGLGFYDRLRSRLVFPIRDMRGRVIAFSGRAMGTAEPKYLNTSDSPVFSKGEALYGIDIARRTIGIDGFSIVVEGNFDLVSLQMAGLKNTVATCGTALTRNHLQVLKRYSRKIILMYDGDKAGQAAAERSLSMFLDEELWPYFVQLPEGRDPDDVVRDEGAEAFKARVTGAIPLLEHTITRYARMGLNSTAQQEAALEVISPILSKLSGPRLDHYVPYTAQHFGISEGSIRGILKARGKREKAPTLAIINPPFPKEEEHVLHWLMQRPQVIMPILIEAELNGFLLDERIKKMVGWAMRQGEGFDPAVMISMVPDPGIQARLTDFCLRDLDIADQDLNRAAIQMVLGVKEHTLKEHSRRIQGEIARLSEIAGSDEQILSLAQKKLECDRAQADLRRLRSAG